MRIDMPTPIYEVAQVNKTVSFELSHLAKLATQQNNINLSYPLFQATIYGTLLESSDSDRLYSLLNEAQRLTFQQGGKGARVEAIAYEALEDTIYATLFRIQGEVVASPLQFIITDSLTSLFRGALYFDQSAVTDSLIPVVDYLQEDIMHLIETFNWNADATIR